MRKLFITILSGALLLPLSSNAQQRIVKTLNFGWRFHAGNTVQGHMTTFDDSSWRTVDLPHDFQIEQPWVAPNANERPDSTNVAANIKSRLSSRGFKEMGKGWYRYHFTPSDSLKGRRLLLDFGGIMYVGDVYLNGELVGKTDYGYVGFEIDITDKLLWNKDNVIAVMADTREPENSRWYTGGGLFRDVRLVVTDKEYYFGRHPLYITTQTENGFSKGHVSIQADIAVLSKSNPGRIHLGVRIINPQGTVIFQRSDTVRRIRQARQQEINLPPVTINNPMLWDCEHPNLYTAELTLYDENGRIRDTAIEQFGIRTIEIGPEFGFKLNGKMVLLKGCANHHTMGALGAAAFPQAIEKHIKLMKEFGINHIRTSHNPYSREFIQLCDKYGILVVDELYDKWSRQHTGGRESWEHLWQKDIPEWVKGDRNSPSVILWSLGNELQQDSKMAFNDWGVTAYKLQKTLLQRYDTTRLVTVAMHPRYRNWFTDSLPCNLALHTDVQAYNYRYMYFPGDGRRFPQMIFYQSEASTAAMGENFYAMNLDKVIGLAYWGVIDYLGESQGWPAKGWNQGVFDISLEPKPKAYLMKSFMKPEEPLVHIAIVNDKNDQMWNGIQTGNELLSDHWNFLSGKKLTLYTFTNADEVELFLNGKSLGRKQNEKNNPKRRNQILWEDIEYQPGFIEARAYNNPTVHKAKPAAIHRIETTGEAVRLVATIDNNHWLADGTDLQHIRIHAVDRKGRRVFSAHDNLHFKVEGDAQLIAATNGDIRSEELYHTDHHRLWNGSAMVILRAGHHQGKVSLTISSEHLRPLKIEFPTHQAAAMH